MMHNQPINRYEQIKRLIIIFICGFILSGLTALPIEWQLHLVHNTIDGSSICIPLTHWIDYIYLGIAETNQRFPFIAYGTDWLAFAHFIIAIAFIGPLRDPVKNIWVIEFGMLACVLIIPFAFIAGSARGIPIFWRLIDCSFGIVGGLILWKCHTKIKALSEFQSNTYEN